MACGLEGSQEGLRTQDQLKPCFLSSALIPLSSRPTASDCMFCHDPVNTTETTILRTDHISPTTFCSISCIHTSDFHDSCFERAIVADQLVCPFCRSPYTVSGIRETFKDLRKYWSVTLPPSAIEAIVGKYLLMLHNPLHAYTGDTAIGYVAVADLYRLIDKPADCLAHVALALDRTHELTAMEHANLLRLKANATCRIRGNGEGASIEFLDEKLLEEAAKLDPRDPYYFAIKKEAMIAWAKNTPPEMEVAGAASLVFQKKMEMAEKGDTLHF
ncbi:hypothetical protein LTS18_008966 [Coniosporium uncinatum]|uniref:Uncharacterized protein n=1 Tax=Coniosporium uncinatum TaxID=93489 RepID=A0ACC3D122_9PEZI|nr:hypothetical protein LTS18_008966 [Coniosporium uncinatum]